MGIELDVIKEVQHGSNGNSVKPTHQTMTLMYISPDTAANWLNNLGPQRMKRTNVVVRYRHDMELGFWKLTHQAIALDSVGRLIDGQHRLDAIVQSGRGQWCWVCRGMTEDEILVIDQHAKRSAADALTIQRGEFIDKNVVALANAMVFYAGGVSFRSSLSVGELGVIIDEYQEAIAFVMSQFSTKSRGVTTASVGSAIALAFYSESKNLLEAFCSVLTTGVPVRGNIDTAALIARNYLTNNAKYMRTDAPSRTACSLLTQRAIKSFCSGEIPKTLRLPEKSIYTLPGRDDLLNRLKRMSKSVNPVENPNPWRK